MNETDDRDKECLFIYSFVLLYGDRRIKLYIRLYFAKRRQDSESRRAGKIDPLAECVLKATLATFVGKLDYQINAREINDWCEKNKTKQNGKCARRIINYESTKAKREKHELTMAKGEGEGKRWNSCERSAPRRRVLVILCRWY